MTFITTSSSFQNHLNGQARYDVVCFSHLRWDFVFQRPQHLLTRFAKNHRVFFIEEPVFGDDGPRLDVSDRENGLHVVTPWLPAQADVDTVMPDLISSLGEQQNILSSVLWFYTPMMLPWAGRFEPLAVVYDCMDELSLFRGAPPQLIEREAMLFERSDLVFTGGQSLYEAKRGRHRAVHAFPSSIDVDHFAQAMSVPEGPTDQRLIAHPRIGYCGVIDERTDVELLERIAGLRPEWQYVMLGPVVKIDEADLPKRPNIHYLGSKKYDELPAYIGGWDVAMMPFALNESTRFISPTKTPEYLAAGRPVVSTPIRDVVRPYGEKGLVHIASDAKGFVSAIEAAMSENANERRARAAEFLATMSWDKTQRAMAGLIDEVVAARAVEMAAAHA
jgi:glycosyltransferase involved in cell wall biosynthesis